MSSHIELVGLPGSGKSTVSGLIRSAARSRSATIYDDRNAYHKCFFRSQFPAPLEPIEAAIPSRVVRAVVRRHGWGTELQAQFRADHPGVQNVAERLLHEYTADPQRKEWMAKRSRAVQAHYQAAQEYLRADESILFDEGFVHYAVSLCCPPRPTKALSEDDINDFLAAVPLPEACIFTQTPIEVCKRRMDIREKGQPGQYARLSTAEFDQYLMRAKRCVRLLKSILEELHVDVIEINTNTDFADTVKQVQEFVAFKTSRVRGQEE